MSDNNQKIIELLDRLGLAETDDGFVVKAEIVNGDASNALHVGEGADDAVHHLLGWCGCGMPDAASAYVFNALRHLYDFDASSSAPINGIERRQPAMAPFFTQEYDDRCKAREDARKETFCGNGAEYFFWYWADEKGLIEHGGSVPGWLTDKGRMVLELLHLMQESAQ